MTDPDLLAAVEAFTKAWRSLTRQEPSMAGSRYVIPSANIPVIFEAVAALNDARLAARSAPASREAGLDAERLARALHAFYAGKDTRYEFFPADCEHPEDARIIAVAYASDDPNDAIAAEYARLATSPVPDSERA